MAKAAAFCTHCGEPRDPATAGTSADRDRCGKCGEAFETSAAAAPELAVGDIVADCRIVKRVGVGGFGTVYRALDQSDPTIQRTVAVKIMAPALSANPDFVQKFLRESRAAALLNHPGIVAIHKVGKDTTRGVHYFVTDFVHGGNLADVVEEKGAFLWQDAVPLMIQACEAVAAAHEADIVHRDLKPANLLFDTSGRVRVTDFGLAKVLAAGPKTVKVMGTPQYMSPEQFEGKPVDARTDIYSLGVSFYYMVSQSLPYEGQNTVQLIYSILTQQPKPLTERNPEIPLGLWIVIEKMIAKRREDRYPSLRDVIQHLRGLPTVGHRVEAAPVSTTHAASGPATPTSVTAAALGPAAPRSPPPPAAPPPAPPPPDAMPAPTEAASGYVFVSYKRGDEPRIAWMLRRMEELGMPVWYDQGITPGGDWFAEILDHIENARAYVVFLTKESVRSRHIDNEVKHAYQHGTPILPVRMEDVDLPKGLRFVLNNVQWVDASLDRDRARTQLDRALRAYAPPKA